MKHTAQPVQILENKWFIQTQFMTQRINFHLADHDIFVAGNHLADRIARSQHDQAECDEADPDEDQHHLAQPDSQLFLSQNYHLPFS